MPRFILAVVLSVSGIHAAVAADSAKVSFNRDVRPILSDACFACHGPDENERQAGLRLDLREGATTELESGATAIVAGQTSESELIRRLITDDESERMPPPEHHKKLTPVQIELLTRWVAEGAEYESHWAYEAAIRPELPAPTAGPVHNPIDLFIQAQLTKEGLAPAAEADRRTLIRRVTLDLHGLPPTIAETEAFVDDTSPNAYAKVVDRLLASPRFAERQAIFWLDAVRYADSVGFHGDQFISVWPYRDYVLRAFHENKPFDQFTREQIAGDLLSNATREQKVASAFNRLNRMSLEGGIQFKEYLAKYAADRVRTVTATWLGSTLGCAECHDHKFDPFTAKDFYRFEAFFADVQEPGFIAKGGQANRWGPILSLPEPEQQAELDRIDAELKRIRAAARQVTNEKLAAGRAEWERRTLALDKSKQLAWHIAQPIALSTEHGAKLTHEANGLIVAGGPNPDNETYSVTFKPGAGRWTSLLVEPEVGELAGNNIARGWVSFLLTEVEADIHGAAERPLRRIRFAEAIAPGAGELGPWAPATTIDGDPKTGWGAEDGFVFASRKLLLRFAEPTETTADTTITVRLQHDSKFRRATMGRFRLRLSPVDGATTEPNGLPEGVLAALRTPVDQRDSKQQKLLADRYRLAAPELAEFRRQENYLEGRHALIAGNVPTVQTTVAHPKPRVTRVLPRGNWMDESGEIVEPNVPEFLGLLDTGDRPATRLDLADWIVSKENPLTARVFVNRQWKHFFGSGLSKVLEDVGSQGEWPSHPRLLDWLACEFMEPTLNKADTHPWDLKHIIRTIVTSHTYRQTSTAVAEIVSRDPENRLLARQSQLRLDAEVIRDTALAVSGLLKERFGGPSVFPIQPEGYWSALNFPKREYSASRGDDLYRRAVYTHWQRTFLHPSLSVFDASSREDCVVNRTNSNTPLQSLVLLNDPIYVEAARAFAQQVILESGSSTDDRIGWAFRRVLGRSPNQQELGILTALYARQSDKFRAAPASGQSLLTVGQAPLDPTLAPVELAAMTTVTRAILNLHETICRD